MRIAALDLGSNSFHLLVADVRPDGGLEAVVRDKEMLRLGSLVAERGEIGEEGMEAAVEVVRRFHAMAESLHAEREVACGTAALRRAADTPVLLDRIRRATGIDVSVIDGQEEARLIFAAVRTSVVIDPAPALALDLGGGSLELMVGDQRELLWATSLEIGVARLTSQAVRSDPPTGADRRRLLRLVDEALDPHLEAIVARQPHGALGSSGTLTTLIALAAGSNADGRPTRSTTPERVNQLTVDLDELRVLQRRLLRLTSAERASLPGVDAKRADLLPAGVVTCVRVMERTGVTQLTGCEWALREGMILDGAGPAVARSGPEDPEALRRQSVLDLCGRCRWPEIHSRKVARLAGELFDGTAHHHGLGDDDRNLLQYGALLHDIGEHVSADSHEQHSAYLIQHGQLRGFSPEEVGVLTCLARFHRWGSPKARFAPWGSLPDERKERTLRLIALLQVADGLDRGHGGPVRDVRVVPGGGRRVTVEADAGGDIDLERYALRRKGQLFARVFGCQLVLVDEHERAGQLAG